MELNFDRYLPRSKRAPQELNALWPRPWFSLTRQRRFWQWLRSSPLRISSPQAGRQRGLHGRCLDRLKSRSVLNTPRSARQPTSFPVQLVRLVQWLVWLGCHVEVFVGFCDRYDNNAVVHQVDRFSVSCRRRQKCQSYEGGREQTKSALTSVVVLPWNHGRMWRHWHDDGVYNLACSNKAWGLFCERRRGAGLPSCSSVEFQ